MSTWLINSQTPEYWGLTITQGEFHSGRASSVTLKASMDFDAAELFAYNATVTILRDGTGFFKGKVREIPKSGSAQSEEQLYLVEDAWAELERIIYQEPWVIRQGAYSGAVYSPTVVLGVSSGGLKIDVGQQIVEALNFAVAQGVSITVGSVPTGMMLWPSEVTGMSVAEVIRDCLKYYPDWIPWIDHSTSPPTFKVTARSAATAVNLAATALDDLSITKTEDRIPAGVRIVYVTANLVEGQVYRNIDIDQYPTVSNAVLRAAAGTGILVTTVELAGMQMQIQKQQVQVRALPLDSTTAKAYLKLKFPDIAGILDARMSVTGWTTAVLPDNDEEVDPIDDKLERIPGGVRSDLPNELVKGSVAEWMQKKVGKVLVEFSVKAVGAATIAEKKKLAKLPKHFTVTATDAETKIYRGVSSFTAAEQRPTGIAQAYYQTLQNACLFSGQVTITDVELPPVSTYHGGKLNVSGTSNTDWASMNAPIHSVTWDLKGCSATINFGPNPEYSIQDFMEFLKLLNGRRHTDYTFEERTGNELGDRGGISAKGDSVGAYDVPETDLAGLGENTNAPFTPELMYLDGATWKVVITPGWVREVLTTDEDAVKWHEIKYAPEAPGTALTATPPPEIPMVSGDFLYVNFKTYDTGAIKEDPKIKVAAAVPESQRYVPPDDGGAGGVDGDYNVKVGKFTVVEGSPSWQAWIDSDIVHIHEVWAGENIGAGAGIWKKFDKIDGAQQFRSVKGNFGLNAAKEANEVKLDLDASNIGGGAAVLKIPEGALPDEPIKARTIRGLNSDEETEESISAQIAVTVADGTGGAAAADTILIRGNGAKGGLTITPFGETPGAAVVSWEDGLVTTVGDVDVELPENPTASGADLNLRITHFESNTLGEMTAVTPDSWLYWRNGLFVGNVDPADSPAALIEETVSQIDLVS